MIRAKAETAPRALRFAENHRQRGPVRLLVDGSDRPTLRPSDSIGSSSSLERANRTLTASAWSGSGQLVAAHLSCPLGIRPTSGVG
jgi:hypothetical protein